MLFVSKIYAAGESTPAATCCVLKALSKRGLIRPSPDLPTRGSAPLMNAGVSSVL